ncbi:MAG: hypothetical protein WAM85_02755 [Terracidiphilus sp.]
MAKQETIRLMIAAGRALVSVDRVREVAALVRARPRKLAQLIECLWREDSGVANRAARADAYKLLYA